MARYLSTVRNFPRAIVSPANKEEFSLTVSLCTETVQEIYINLLAGKQVWAVYVFWTAESFLCNSAFQEKRFYESFSFSFLHNVNINLSLKRFFLKSIQNYFNSSFLKAILIVAL